MTEMPYQPGGSSQQRGRETVFWTGFSESMTAETRGNSPLLYRRIVFVSFGNIALAAYKRTSKGEPFRPTLVDPMSWPAVIRDSIFPRLKTEDWVDIHVAKVDGTELKVLSDQTWQVRAAGNGQVQEKTWWTPLFQQMDYGAVDGVDGTSSWSSRTSPLGNVYVLDIFANREDDERVSPASVSSEITLYWRE